MKESTSDRVFIIICTIIIVIAVLLVLYPIYFTIIASFSDPSAVVNGNVLVWVNGFTLDSYRSIIKYQQLWVGYRNTFLYTTFGTLGNLVVLLPCAYALSKRYLRGRGLLMVYFIIPSYFGGGMIPFYMLIRNLGLVNNPLVLILPMGVSFFYLVVTRTFFTSSDYETLAEAARIDGANEFRIFFSIILPLSGAIIAVMALYNAVAHWNSFFSALIFINDSKFYPLQLILRQILLLNQSVSFDTRIMTTEMIKDNLRRAYLAETLKYSLIIIASLPLLIAYPFVQKYFVKGVMIGSVKG